MPFETEIVAPRVKAAQALGGFGRIEALAEALKGTKISLTRLRELTQPTRKANDPRSWELREIARVCGVGYGLFTLDLEQALEETPDGWRADMEGRLQRIEARLSPLLEESVVPPLPNAMLQRMKEALPSVEVRGQPLTPQDEEQPPPAQVDQPGA